MAVTTDGQQSGIDVAGGVRDRSDQVCIIGAGPAGLAAARALADHEVAYAHVERHQGLGGIWDINAPGSPMYEAAHLISSRDASGFPGFPMPAEYPDYPGHRQVLAYLRRFADHYALTDKIECGREVVALSETDDGRWLVRFASGERCLFRAMVCASGSQWHPRMPEIEGDFSGVVTPARDFRSGVEYAGTRTLVIGAGNSGCDIAVDVGRFAAGTFLSARRGYWIIPKHIAGVPSDQLKTAARWLPRRLDQVLSAAAIRLVTGDLRRFGLQRPDHRLYETHPIVNSQLLHALAHGDVRAKPDVVRYDGDRVRFADGTSEEVDRIIMATGYRPYLPYADGYFDGIDEQRLYLATFSRRHHNLFFLGMSESNAGGFALFDAAAGLIARYLRDQQADPARADRFRRRIVSDRPDLTGGLRLSASPRHDGYIDADTFLRTASKVATEMEWTPGRRPARSRPNPLPFRDAIIAVTGAAGGLGSQICAQLAARGATVVAIDRDQDLADRLVRELPRAPGRPHHAVGADLAHAGAVAEVSGELNRYPRLDAIIHNAGMSHGLDFPVLSAAQIEAELRVNLLAPLQLTSEVLGLLTAADRPRVVFTGSLGGIVAMGTDPLYSASKFGVRGAALSLQLALAGEGVAVIGVHPSAIDTPMLEHEARRGAEPSQFMTAPQTPAQVAAAVVRGLLRPRPEIYPSPFDGFLARAAMLAPNLLPRLIPIANRLGRRGLERYRASLAARTAAGVDQDAAARAGR